MMEDITSYKKILVFSLIFLALLLIVPFISAAKIDNVKGELEFGEGISEYGKIEIKNWFGLQKLIELELKTNTDVCATDCSAEIDILMHKPGVLIEDVRFVGANINDYEFYIEVGKDKYDVDDYETQCSNGKYLSNNNTYEQLCSDVKVGSHKESKSIWEVYNLGGEVSEGDYKIKLEGRKDKYETTDWQITSQGRLINEWALWEGVDSPRFVLDMNITGTTVTDAVNGSTNGVFDGTLADVDGILGRALRFEENDNVNVTYVFNNASDFTIQLWIKTSENTNALFGSTYPGAPAGTHEGIAARINDNQIQFIMTHGGAAGGPQTSYTVTSGTWQHVVLTWDADLLNASIYINGTRDISAVDDFGINLDGKFAIFGAPSSDIVYAVNNTSIDEFILWKRVLSDSEIVELYNGGAGTAYDPLTFTVTLNSPADANITLAGQNNIFNCTAKDILLNNIQNISLYINTTGDFILNQTQDVSGLSSPEVTVGFGLALSAGEFTWSCRSSIIGSSVFAEQNRTIEVVNLFQLTESFNSTSYQTENEPFFTNISIYGTETPTANLVYNDVKYSATVTNEGNNNFGFQRNIDIGSTLLGDYDFFWNVNHDGNEINLSSDTQTVQSATLNICNGTNGATFINFTFLDEETDLAVNASADLASWEYYLGSGAETKTLLYTNNTEQLNYPFCFSASNETLHNTLTFQYAGTGYPQRIHVRNSDLTKATTNQSLYLLGTADGIYSSIQTVNTIGAPESGVVVQIERQFDGLWTLIGQDTTDSSGLVTFWVNPDYDHRLTFTKVGCGGTSQTIRPTQASYTQTLVCEGGSEAVYISQIEGIRYTRGPRSGILAPGIINFTYTLFSEKDNIVNASFQILNLTGGNILNSTSSTCTLSGCVLSFTYDAIIGEQIKGRYYLDIGNGNVLIEADAYWRLIATNVTDTGTIKQFWQNFATLFDEWGADEVDLNNKIEYSRFVFIFMFLAIALGLFNKSIGNYDGQYPGALAIAVALLIWTGSLAGGLSGQGFFFYSNLFGNTATANFMNNYILAILSSFMAAAIVLGTARRNS